jgi:hypothetical protein
VKRLPAWVPIALVVAIVARAAASRVVARVGHAGAPLDDAYIHFQYARAIAEGHPFRYSPGAAPTSGATSLLWPVLLAAAWLVGFREEAVVWAAWALAFVALGALAWEARAIARGLAGEAAGLGAAAMVLAFPAFAWFAASGMEGVPFAWLLARGVRRASEWTEAPREGRTRRFAWELAGLALAAPLMRPEGALASLAIAAATARHAPRDLPRAFALAPLVLGVAAPPLVLLAFTGDARSTTALVKLLPGNPYYAGDALVAKLVDNARLLLTDILGGGYYSAEFVPSGGAGVALAGLVAVALTGARAKKPWRAALVVGLALAMFVPCAYVTFLWNRLRYLWPFATGWLVGLACLARVAGDAAGWLAKRGRLVTPIACGAFAGMFLVKMGGALDDVAQSASGIDRQQVSLGRWVRASLPLGARVGVNDAGAIAYFGERPTFDVVGLTTKGEGRYWVAGAGSRLEHYERLHARDPGALPTHFVVYPEWFGCEALLGEALRTATVTDATILGGQSMRAYVADYRLLGSGEAPWTTLASIDDAVDVADLESEAEHGYALLGARDGEEVAGYAPSADGRPVVDGGRTARLRDRFVAHLRKGRAARGVARVESSALVHARVSLDGRAIAAFDVEPDGWGEVAFDVPADAARAASPVTVDYDGPVTVFHYWFGQAAPDVTAPASARSGSSP